MNEKIKRIKQRIQEWEHSLNNRILMIVYLCGILPILSIVVFVVISYRSGIIEKTEMMAESEIQYVASMISGRLDDAITVCQTLTYDGSYEGVWSDYQDGRKSESDFYSAIKIKLRRLFNLDRKYDGFAFYEVNHEQPVCFTSRMGESFNEYVEQIDPVIQTVRETENPDAQIIIIGDRIFIVRNLYTIGGYKKFGTLAVEMNTASLFRGITPGITENMAVFLNDKSGKILISGNISEPEQKKVEAKLWKTYDKKKNRTFLTANNLLHTGYMWNQNHDDYYLSVMYLAKNQEMYSELYDFYKVIMVVVLVMALTFVYIFYFLKRQISEPVTRMIEASKAIEEGALGTIVEGEEMPNKEFEYLKESFNKMSKQVKYLFDCAYDEKMARKDAKIMALQAQINPHFLNNTLEMMNWQARMSGDLEVSGMIESLGIVLDYNMNRESKRLTSLAEELRCADAYFYIISKRFGKRLTVEKEIDQELLQIRVPQLVLQPIIENAVVHGIERVKVGKIKIRIYRDKNIICLQVINSGKPMTEEEKCRIIHLLNQPSEEIQKGSGHHVSLAIRNINERVKLIYGDSYGLSIEPDGEYTVSTIKIPYQPTAEVDERERRKKLQKQLEITGRFE